MDGQSTHASALDHDRPGSGVSGICRVKTVMRMASTATMGISAGTRFWPVRTASCFTGCVRDVPKDQAATDSALELTAPARYVKLVALSEIEGKPYTAVAEINLLAD